MSPYAEQLADAVDAVTGPWIRARSAHVLRRAGLDPAEPGRAEALDRVATDTRTYVALELRAFLELDVDEQRTNPLAVLRRAVASATRFLATEGVEPVRRDEFDVRAFPDDLYALGPATWRDVDESLHEPGIIWGAWKAKTVLDRRRAEGRR